MRTGSDLKTEEDGLSGREPRAGRSHASFYYSTKYNTFMISYIVSFQVFDMKENFV